MIIGHSEDIVIPTTKKRQKKRGTKQSSSQVTKKQVIEDATKIAYAGNAGEKGLLLHKSLIVEGSDKTTDKLVIGGNNTVAARIMTPPSGGSSHISGSSSARVGMTQITTVMELGIIWKPLIVDDIGYNILETHSGFINPMIAASVATSCILHVDQVEMSKLTKNNDAIIRSLEI